MMEQAAGDKKNLKNIRKCFHPHRNPVDAVLLPGIADSEGEQLGAAPNSPSGTVRKWLWCFLKQRPIFFGLVFVFQIAVQREPWLYLGEVNNKFCMS